MIAAKVIRRKGLATVVELPLAEWRRIERALARAEERDDVRAYDAARRGIDRDGTIPAEIVHDILDGENAVRVLRRWRKLTQLQLAAKAGLAALYVSQIETGRRTGSPRVLRALAAALDVDLDLVVPRPPTPRASPRAPR